MSSTTAVAATVASSSITNHVSISQAFIQDDFVIQCSHAQNQTFLRTGIVPQVGQRVDLTIVLNSFSERGDLPFRLSGEVTVVHPMPTFRSEGSITCPNAQYRPSSSPSDYGPSRGSSLLAFILRKKLPQERVREDGSVPNLNGIWERVVSTSKKEDIQSKVVKKFGALHGQQVVCEGRCV